MSNVVDLTKGNVTKLILKFFFPMLFSNMLQQFYSFVDTAIVSRGLGDNALAAVGNMGSLFFLIVGFSIGLANGFSVLIAQDFGERNEQKLRHSLSAAIVLAAIIGVILTVHSLIFLPQMLILLQTDPLIMRDSLTYGYIVFGGLMFSISYNMSAFILRAFGDSKTPLKAIIISSVLNLGLDCFFIFVLKTGVEGAAIATVFSQLMSAVICIRKIRTIEFAKLKKEDFKNDGRLYGRMLLNGIPMAFMNSITAIGCMVIQYFVNGFGVDYTTAYSVCGKYTNLFMMPACTAGQSMAAFTGQNSGAGRYDRIRQGLFVCLSIAVVSYITLGAFMFFGKHFLAGLLLDGDKAKFLASQYLEICGSMLIMVDCLFVFRSGVQGMGKPLIPMFSGVLEMVMRVGIICAFSGTIGFRATAFAETGAWIAALMMNLIAFVRIYSVMAEKNAGEIRGHFSAKKRYVAPGLKVH